jgi:response regulator NasT
VVASDDAEWRTNLSRQLVELGNTAAADGAAVSELADRCREHSPDVALLDLRSAAGPAFDSAERVARETPGVPVLMLAGDGVSLGEAQLLRTTALGIVPRTAAAKLIDTALRLAVLRARELRGAREESGALRTQLENRKSIERAKGILMRRTGLSEQEAYRILQRTSQDRSVPMAVVAKEVLESEPGR